MKNNKREQWRAAQHSDHMRMQNVQMRFELLNEVEINNLFAVKRQLQTLFLQNGQIFVCMDIFIHYSLFINVNILNEQSITAAL